MVFFDTQNKRKKKANYVGIYLGKNEFIAATTKHGVTVLKLTDKYWATKYIGAKRVVNVKKDGGAANEFSLTKVRVGDVISGMKVESVLIPHKEYQNQLPTRVLFEGKTTISGTISVNNSGALMHSFIPDEDSLKRLPILDNKKGQPMITFEDQETTQAIFGNVKDKQKATITIDSYRIHYVGNDIWKTAELVKEVK